MSKLQPVIKWTGSKRLQAEQIIKHFPKEINVYYECFLGGGSIFKTLLDKEHKINQVVCSDNNVTLIELWSEIKNDPYQVYEHYLKNWIKFQSNYDYFYEVRTRFNENKDPLDFLFLLRTCANGLARFNLKGEFNSPVHKGRPGIHPDKLKNIIMDWHEKINKYNVQFLCRDYKDIEAKEGDFMYLDPPYANVNGSVYHGGFQYDEFWEWLGNQQCGYALSFDGITGNKDMTFEVPSELYSKHVYLENGISGFGKIHKKREYGKESLYIK